MSIRPEDTECLIFDILSKGQNKNGEVFEILLTYLGQTKPLEASNEVNKWTRIWSIADCFHSSVRRYRSTNWGSRSTSNTGGGKS